MSPCRGSGGDIVPPGRCLAACSRPGAGPTGLGPLGPPRPWSCLLVGSTRRHRTLGIRALHAGPVRLRVGWPACSGRARTAMHRWDRGAAGAPRGPPTSGTASSPLPSLVTGWARTRLDCKHCCGPSLTRRSKGGSRAPAGRGPCTPAHGEPCALPPWGTPLRVAPGLPPPRAAGGSLAGYLGTACLPAPHRATRRARGRAAGPETVMLGKTTRVHTSAPSHSLTTVHPGGSYTGYAARPPPRQ